MKGASRLILAIVLAAAAPAEPAAAQGLADYDYENLTFRGIGAAWGRIWPDKVDATTIWSLRVDMGFLGPAVRVVPGVSYWKSDLKNTEVDRLAARLSDLPALRSRNITITAADLGRVEWSALSLTLDTHALWTAPYRVFTYAGLGLGLHAMNGQGESVGDTFVEDLLDSITAGIAFMAGAEYEPTPVLRVFAEARYAVQSEIRYPALKLGAMLMVPSRTGRSP